MISKLLQLDSPPPRAIRTTSYGARRRIRCATSLAIIRSTPRIHDDSASATFFAHITTPVSVASPDASSSSVPPLLHIVHDSTDVPSLNDAICVPGSFHAARQTSIESLRIPATPIDPAVATTSGIMIHHPTPETSTSTPPLSATSPPTAVFHEHNADIPMPSDAPNL